MSLIGAFSVIVKTDCGTDGSFYSTNKSLTPASLQTQCVTDRLQTGDKLTVPVFTDLCSAVCWGEQVNRIHDCPYNGRRSDVEIMSSYFAVTHYLAGWTGKGPVAVRRWTKLWLTDFSVDVN